MQKCPGCLDSQGTQLLFTLLYELLDELFNHAHDFLCAKGKWSDFALGVLPKTGRIALCIHFPRNKLYNFGSFLCSYLSHLGYFAESDIFLTANAEKPLPGETASIQLELIFLGLEKVAKTVMSAALASNIPGFLLPVR